ncbi:hypothetical protein PHYBOEH_001598 [Phytophthora boehmeriae]|uniref:Auto-transporter adhesin head GIN domain-containing protein n=1 Tax=Phytophthora boehmeriae TaxID=109152 RepID=A0A8T1V502_9STRA|nr:hypothetical protein PHYBOEH_001598 [Phytophthora boehmeriae]
MKTSSIFAFLLVAVSMTASATADFTATPGKTKAVAVPEHNANFAKKWTLKAGANTGAIDSLELAMEGRVHVSYTNTLPQGVIGYVNVTGSSKDLVNAVTVGSDLNDDNDGDDNDDMFDLDDVFDGKDNEELYVRLGNGATKGHLLTEIVLASSSVRDVKSSRSAQVVIEDGVLDRNSRAAELEIKATGSSAVFVSAAKTAVNVRKLKLEASSTSRIEYQAGTMAVRSETQMEAQGSAVISVLSSSLTTNELELEAQGTATICVDAAKVSAKRPAFQGRNKISMPNAVDNYGSTGTFACEKSKLPARRPGKVVVTGNAAGNGAFLLDDDGELDDDVNDLNDDLDDDLD